MQLVKYNPFKELQKMERDMDKFWNNDWNFPTLLVENTAIDMYEEDGKLAIEMQMPNFKKNEITINFDGGFLEISAIHEEKDERDSRRHYFIRESTNSYYRRVLLPEGADGDGADAEYKNGTLKLTMPMIAPKPLKTIDIK